MLMIILTPVRPLSLSIVSPWAFSRCLTKLDNADTPELRSPQISFAWPLWQCFSFGGHPSKYSFIFVKHVKAQCQEIFFKFSYCQFLYCQFSYCQMKLFHFSFRVTDITVKTEECVFILYSTIESHVDKCWQDNCFIFFLRLLVCEQRGGKESG